MIDASLDASAIKETLASIANGADFLDVTLHGTSVAPGHVSIDEAFSALLSGDAVAVRLSYRIRESAWSAILTRAKTGFRLLRVPRAASGYSGHGE
jgi:hypothetical protein